MSSKATPSPVEPELKQQPHTLSTEANRSGLGFHSRAEARCSATGPLRMSLRVSQSEYGIREEEGASENALCLGPGPRGQCAVARGRLSTGRQTLGRGGSRRSIGRGGAGRRAGAWREGVGREGGGGLGL